MVGRPFLVWNVPFLGDIRSFFGQKYITHELNQAVAQMNGMGSSAGGVPPGTPQEAWMVDLYSLECPLLAYHGMFVCLDFGVLFLDSFDVWISLQVLLWQQLQNLFVGKWLNSRACDEGCVENMRSARWTADACGRHGESNDWGAQSEWMEEVVHYRKYMKIRFNQPRHYMV